MVQKISKLYEKEIVPILEEMWVYILQAARCSVYEGWNFNSGNYLFTTDTK